MTDLTDLTYQRLLQDITRMRRTLYYATQPDIERGKAYISKATKLTPEFIVCHPDDLPQLQDTGIALKHIRDWRPKAMAPESSSSILAMFERSLWELTP